MNVRFIRKGGKIIPIKSDISSVKKANLMNEIESVSKMMNKVKSPFIKNNAAEKIKSLVEKVRFMEQMA